MEFIRKVAKLELTWLVLGFLGWWFFPPPLVTTDLGLAIVLGTIGGVVFIITYNLALLVIYGLKGAIPVAVGVVPAIYGAAWPATIMPSATTVVGEVFGAILVGMVIGGVWSFSALLIEHRRSQKPTPNM